MLAQAGDELDLDFLAPSFRVGVLQECFQHLGVEHQRLEVVAD